MNTATKPTAKPVTFTHPTRMTRKAGTDHSHYATVSKQREGYIMTIIVDKVAATVKNFDKRGDAFEWLQRDGFVRDR